MTAEVPGSLLSVRGLSIHYQDKQALGGVDLDVLPNEIFGIIGPANAGKTSFLRAINRMDEFVPNMRVDGTIRFAGRDVRQVRNLYALRRRVGVVFPLPDRPVFTGDLHFQWLFLQLGLNQAGLGATQGLRAQVR